MHLRFWRRHGGCDWRRYRTSDFEPLAEWTKQTAAKPKRRPTRRGRVYPYFTVSCFYLLSLPAHAHRDMCRALLPIAWRTLNGSTGLQIRRRRLFPSKMGGWQQGSCDGLNSVALALFEPMRCRSPPGRKWEMGSDGGQTAARASQARNQGHASRGRK